ncbi:hypothetical protein [Bradyrhizobium sp.]|jgi:hypothetical protein|uniref:hypothetical protein n=1 Tax=Bradyrhizobium sp. TaxID=376 RepID=UPI003C224BF6
MADYSLVAVDHQPEFDHSVLPVDHDPFSGGADDMIAQARAQLASQNLRDPATFDPRTYAPTNEARQIASRMPVMERSVFNMLRGAADAVAYPADVYAGRASPDDTARGLNMALTTIGGAGPFVRWTASLERELAQSGGKALESRSSLMYNPPIKAPRSFEGDYPGGGIADESGKLRFDIDGNPLTGAHVSGRQVVGGPDVAIAPAQYDAIAEGSIGAIPEARSANSLPRGTAGRYSQILTPDGPERSIAYLKTLNPPAAEKVIAHEIGHALDEMSGQIPTAGLNTELRQLYNTLNTGRERTANLTGPQHLGYGKEEAPRELMAEAIRAYMVNPNYIKTVAPQTAARIRQYVNANPALNRTIQFNAGGLPLPPGLALVPVDHDPFAGPQ